MDTQTRAMRAVLNKPGRDERMMLRRRVCKPCGRQFATRGRYVEHIAVHLVVKDCGVGWDTALRLWRRHGWDLVHEGPDGTRRMVLPDGEPGET